MADQLKFCFEPVGCDQWENLREYINDELIPDRCRTHRLQRKYIAADLELSPSRLKRKLTPSVDDTSRFTTDDLERWLEKFRDLRPLHYLYEKYSRREEEREWHIQRLRELGIDVSEDQIKRLG